MNSFSPFTFLLLLSMLTCASLAAQQRVDADLVNNGVGYQEIVLQSTSDVRYGEVGNEEITLQELDAFEDGYAEFTIDHFSADEEVMVSLVQNNSPTVAFSMQFAGGDISLINFGSSGINVGTYSNQDVFRIERILNKIYYYKNNVRYTVEGTLNPNRVLVARVNVTKATDSQGNLPHLELEFPIVRPREFTVLKNQLDGSYVKTKGDYLCFQYIEDYAIVTNENDEIEYAIYDQAWLPKSHNAGDPLPTLSNEYGVNWKVLELPNNLVAGDYYVLQVNGPNKGESYYLRFQMP